MSSVESLTPWVARERRESAGEPTALAGHDGDDVIDVGLVLRTRPFRLEAVTPIAPWTGSGTTGRLSRFRC